MMKRVLLIGGTGVFGSRLARHLAASEDLDLVLTSRSLDKARALSDSISPAASSRVTGIRLDRDDGLAARLSELSPWLVIDASGPFQGADYHVPRAVLASGAHSIDLADARDYIAGFGAALDAIAQDHGLVALTGASSTPALSAAAANALTDGWRRVDFIDFAITPGGRSEVGPAVIEAILTYVGKPVPVWREGALEMDTGWLESQRVQVPGLGQRRVALVETCDAETLGPRLRVQSRVIFRAGLESTLEQCGLTILALLRKAGFIRRLRWLAPALSTCRKLTRLATSNRGGMLVSASGLGPDGRLQNARWSLLAEKDHGPHVPTLAAAALVKAIAEGAVVPGARSATADSSLPAIVAEAEAYAITTKLERVTQSASLMEIVLGPERFADLPAPLRAFHESTGAPVWRGEANVSPAENLLSRFFRRLFKLPPAGSDIPITFTVDRSAFDEQAPSEIWTRNFAGRRFATQLNVDRHGLLFEHFGPIAFELGIAQHGQALQLCLKTAILFGVRLPRFTLPRVRALEGVDANERFTFDIEIDLPLIGALIRYSGWLQSAATDLT